jgi:hypothetical protein
MRFTAAATATAALATAIAMPQASMAHVVTPSQSITANYTTKLVPQYGAGEWAGSLTITTQPDGAITGTYRTDAGDLIPVVGGRDGDHVWLDLGLRSALSIVGTVDESGEIHGATREPQEVSPYGLVWESFTATVAAK